MKSENSRLRNVNVAPFTHALLQFLVHCINVASCNLEEVTGSLKNIWEKLYLTQYCFNWFLCFARRETLRISKITVKCFTPAKWFCQCDFPHRGFCEFNPIGSCKGKLVLSTRMLFDCSIRLYNATNLYLVNCNSLCLVLLPQMALLQRIFISSLHFFSGFLLLKIAP